MNSNCHECKMWSHECKDCKILRLEAELVEAKAAIECKDDTWCADLDDAVKRITDERNALSAQCQDVRTRREALAAELDAWFKDEAKFYGLPYDGDRKSSVAKLGDRIRTLEADLHNATLAATQNKELGDHHFQRCRALEAALRKYGNHSRKCDSFEDGNCRCGLSDILDARATAETSCEHSFREIGGMLQCEKCSFTKPKETACGECGGSGLTMQPGMPDGQPTGLPCPKCQTNGDSNG